MFEDTKKKRSCCAMDETGNCKICEKNCHYSSHYNSKEVRKVRKVKVKQTNSELKSKYHMAEN